MSTGPPPRARLGAAPRRRALGGGAVLAAGLAGLGLLAAVAACRPGGAEAPARAYPAPRAWDAAALADWANPVAGLGMAPGHSSVEAYYAAPVDNLRTYPVYHPDREPPGYFARMQSLGPQPLVEQVGGARTREEWIALGERVFRELDVKGFRVADPEAIGAVRSREELARYGSKVLADGTVFGLRWVPTPEGLRLGLNDCSRCHSRVTDEGTVIPGAPLNVPFDGIASRFLVLPGLDFFMPGEPLPVQLHRLYAVPWVAGDVNDRILGMGPEELGGIFTSLPGGIIARANSSPFYPNKIPDLIGIGEQRYIDHTGTHQLRGVEDVMRYAANVSYEDPMDFGPYQFYSDEQRFVRYRHTDDALFALANYLFSLRPPPSPHPRDAAARAGERLFRAAGCALCHTPPAYTNGRLTPVDGFTPPAEHYRRLRIHNASVGTDPGQALKTRKGTGYYKVPSLRGLWYRGHFLHDGSLARLEELFDPRRLADDFVPSGFKGYEVERRAVRGHEFALDLDAGERSRLVAFLLTL